MVSEAAVERLARDGHGVIDRGERAAQPHPPPLARMVVEVAAEHTLGVAQTRRERIADRSQQNLGGVERSGGDEDRPGAEGFDLPGLQVEVVDRLSAPGRRCVVDA